MYHASIAAEWSDGLAAGIAEELVTMLDRLLLGLLLRFC